MRDARLAQPLGNELEKTRELREHERLFPALHGRRNQIDDRIELGGRPAVVLVHQTRVAAQLAQARDFGEHLDG